MNIQPLNTSDKAPFSVSDANLDLLPDEYLILHNDANLEAVVSTSTPFTSQFLKDSEEARNNEMLQHYLEVKSRPEYMQDPITYVKNQIAESRLQSKFRFPVDSVLHRLASELGIDARF